MKASLRLLIPGLFLSTFLFNGSCNLINPPEQIPSYIQLDSPSVTITAGLQGTSNQKITDGWVYVDGTFQGAYEMPVTFPLLKQGTKNILISPGIIENGVSATRVQYPFFYTDTFSVNLEPKKTYSFHPQFKYRSNTLFLMNEDFESGNNFIKLNGDTTFVRVNDANVLEGSFSGFMGLSDSMVFGECISSQVYDFPTDGSPVYIEMNYKCDHEFRVGVIAHTTGADVKFYQWNITAHADWNKIYLHLNDLLQSLGTVNFNIVIEMIKSDSEPEARLWVDNIKLLTLQ